jgi:hypothetical protein
MSRSALLAVVLAAATITSALAGCASRGERLSSNGSATTERTIDLDDLLDDASMTDDRSMTVEEVQSFLEQTPYGRRSVLASYRPKGKAASQIIVDTAREYALSPKLLLVRAQLEQGLVSKQTATPRQLDRALGCGCVDAPAAAGDSTGHTCAARYVGFENQVRCAASTLRHALDSLAGPKHATLSGWRKGTAKKTLDGIAVTPKNDATAALYAYTPWVGELGGGRSGVGGTSAHWQLWNDFSSSSSNGDSETTRRDGGAAEPNDPSDPSDPSEPLPSCEGTCSAGEVCSESGACVVGCQVLGTVDSCPSGSRCDRRDGLVGTCRAQTCACSGSAICDVSTGTPRCVQCTVDDTSSCRAEGAGEGCVAGRCGCRTSADCGYDRARICDPVRNVCIDDPTPSAPAPAKPDAETDAAAPEPPEAEDPSTLPAPAATPDLPEPMPSKKSSKSSEKAAETIDVPGESSGGCAVGVGPTSLGSWGFLLALAVFARGARRRARR